MVVIDVEQCQTEGRAINFRRADVTCQSDGQQAHAQYRLDNACASFGDSLFHGKWAYLAGEK
jgi:hypothetical protein